MKKPEPTLTLTLPARVARALCHCLRCDHWWLRRGDEIPAFCPACKRRHWDVAAGALQPGRPAKNV
jgi:hypothetical protein